MITLIYRHNSPNPDFLHETGFDIDHAVLADDGKSKSLYVSKMNLDFARRHWKGAKPLGMDALGRLIKGKEVGMSFRNESASFLDFARKRARKVVDIGDRLMVKRSAKTEKEVSSTRKAARISLEIIRGIRYSREKTELQVAKELKIAALERGLELAFEPIVATGINSSFPHSVPERRRLKGHVLVDFGVKVNGCCGDISNVTFLDRSCEAALAYEKARQAFHMITDGLKEAETGNDVYLLYRKAFRRLGLPEMPHGIGHGIGLEVHEYPYFRKGSDNPVRGATMAIEPSIYVKNRFGVRFERDIFVSKRGKVEIF
jgi:Xaa-Pro dipeptidase